jgi:hypothetical protein
MLCCVWQSCESIVVFRCPQSLWWRRGDVEVMLNSVGQQLASGSLSRKFVPLAVLVLADATANCHPLTQLDEAGLGTAALDLAQSWLSVLVTSIEEHILAVVAALGKVIRCLPEWCSPCFLYALRVAVGRPVWPWAWRARNSDVSRASGGAAHATASKTRWPGVRHLTAWQVCGVRL